MRVAIVLGKKLTQKGELPEEFKRSLTKAQEMLLERVVDQIEKGGRKEIVCGDE